MPILNWLTRDDDVRAAQRVPYRLLEPVPDMSEGSPDTENMLIQGDNLDALKALLPFYAGRVKCIYIDPPYNTGAAFEHYDDNLEHTQWLAMMWPRLELLRELLAEDGSIWVSIDDNEAHYLKVVMDEIFGRRGFIVNALWQKRTSPDGRIHMGDAHDHILVYGSPAARTSWNELTLSIDQENSYKNPDNDPNGPWASTDFTAQGFRPNQMYTITTPGGAQYTPPEGRCWANVEDNFNRLVEEGRMWFGRKGNSRPRVKNYLSEANGVKSWSWWSNKDAGHNQEAKKEVNALFGASNAFDTPKPERLIQRILKITTNPGDLVLDSFLGSGTTAAVAHKMGRRYIGIELGGNATTHCVPRLKKVIGGEQGGISEAERWQGGGGFRFFRLGESVLDDKGHFRADIPFSVLAAHVWFSETGKSWAGASPSCGSTELNQSGTSPLLGIEDGRAYALLHSESQHSGSVLNRKALSRIRADICQVSSNFKGELAVYGESCRLAPSTLDSEHIVFKQMPYDIKMRV